MSRSFCLPGKTQYLFAALISLLLPLFSAASAIEVVGTTAGSFSVATSGDAVYSIPIQTPPNPSGLEPELSIVYKSSIGNGPLGVGWTIGGLSAVTRCPATIERDGFAGAVSFDADDRFCLDGQRLIEVGTYDGGTEYRTEHESWSRIVAYGSQGYGPEYFKVWTKSGQLMEYGFNSDSRIEAVSAQGNVPLLSVKVWGLDSITSLDGSEITIEYFEDQLNGDYRPTAINYSGRSVLFEVEPAPRPDVIETYVGGTINSTTQRLKHIKTFVGNELVRDYILDYVVSSSTGRSRLSTVTECTGDNECTPPTVFDYEDMANEFEAKDNFISNKYGSWYNQTDLIRSMDVNGDGRKDIVIGPKSTGEWLVMLATDNGYQDKGNWESTLSYGYWHDYPDRIRPMDVNGDGMEDIVIGPAAAGRWYVLLSTGHSFEDQGEWEPTLSYGYWYNHTDRIRPMDVNGDGMKDIVIGPAAAGRWYVLLSTGHSFEDQGEWEPTLSYGGWYTEANRIRPMDVNGDGMSDIVLGPATNGSWHVLLSTGTSFKVQASPWASAYGAWWDDPKSIRSFDADGDGLQDILIGPDQAGNWNLLTPNGQKPDLLKSVVDGLGSKVSIQYAPLSADAVYSSDGNTSQYPIREIRGAKYVVSQYGESNGLGGDCDLENQILAGCRLFEYSYQGSRFHITGKRPLWFHNVTVSDVDAGAYSEIERIQTAADLDWGTFLPEELDMATRVLAGLVRRKTAGVLGGKVLKSTEKEYGYAEPISGVVYYSYQTRKDEKLYELNHAGSTPCLSSTKIAEQPDVCGNSLGSTETMSDGWAIETTMTTTYRPMPGFACIPQDRRVVITSISPELGPAPVSRSRTMEYDYDSAGRLLAETIDPDDPQAYLTTQYAYYPSGHAWAGLLHTTTVDGPDLPEPRVSTISSYDVYGFPDSAINPEGYPTSQVIDPSFGLPLSKTDLNELTTLYDYDGFGRLKMEDPPGSAVTEVFYELPGAADPVESAMIVRTIVHGSGSANASESAVWQDALGREVRKGSVWANGNWSFADTIYNAKGQVYQVSNTYLEGNTPQWTVYTYDDAGRVDAIDNPGGGLDYAYDGLTVSITDGNLHTTTKTKDSEGNVIEVVDALLNPTTYRYGPFGVLREAEDAYNNITSMTYDNRGRKLSMDDPDAGYWSYEYYASGELKNQTDNKNQYVEMTYDNLGRMTTRTEKTSSTGTITSTTTWTYDTASDGVGKLATVTSTGEYDFYSESHSYKLPTDADPTGRHIVTKTVNGEVYDTIAETDAYGRVEYVTYPTGFTIRNEYNNNGYLEKVWDDGASQWLWSADYSGSADLYTTYENFGNGVNTVRGYDSATGLLNTISSGKLGGAEVQNLQYDYDDVGNLTWRYNHNEGLSEQFYNDELNRLKWSEVNAGNRIDLSYDDLGNITYKSDVGYYQYDQNNAGPHAVTRVTSDEAGVNTVYEYTYDANGNQTSRSSGSVAAIKSPAPPRVVALLPLGIPAVIPLPPEDNGGFSNQVTIEYASFNKPKAIKGPGSTIEYFYNPSHERVVRKTATTNFVYIGNLYEKERKGSSVEHKHNIYANGKLIAIYTQIGDGSTESVLRYVHLDHLDSVETLTDETGNVVQHLSYDPWGRRRDPTTWQQIVLGSVLAQTELGFTGHNHEDEAGLVYMNARMYDSMLGRFLSPDIMPDGLNRYSYVKNNPLSFVDPTGHWGVRNFLRKHLGNWTWWQKNVERPVADAFDRFDAWCNKHNVHVDVEVETDVAEGDWDEDVVELGTAVFEYLFGDNLGWAWFHPIEAFNIAKYGTRWALSLGRRRGLDPQVNDNKYGHAMQVSITQKQYGVVSAPIITVVGVLYEIAHFFFPGHTQEDKHDAGYERTAPFFGFTDGQHPVNWSWDTPGDLMANTVGQITAILGMHSITANRIVFTIPGPDYSKKRWVSKGRPKAGDFYQELAPPGFVWPY